MKAFSFQPPYDKIIMYKNTKEKGYMNMGKVWKVKVNEKDYEIRLKGSGDWFNWLFCYRFYFFQQKKIHIATRVPWILWC